MGWPTGLEPVTLRIDATGRPAPIGKVGDTLWWLRIAPTGRVWALTVSQLEEGEAGALYLVAEDTAQGS